MKNNQKIKILLLSAPIGSGHKMAAEALREVFSQNRNIEVVHGNIFSFFPAFIGNLFLKTYLQILRICPAIYALAYKWGNTNSGSLRARNLLNACLAKLGKSYVEKIAPDAVIATHATPAGIMSIYKKNFRQDLYLSAVVTDYTIHKWWLYEEVNTYFIADEILQDKITGKSEVICYGIPIRMAFKNLDYQKAREKYKFQNDEKVCLLLGGGDGLLPMEDIIRNIGQMDLRIIAVAGNNFKLAEKLKNISAKNLMVLNFTEDLPSLIAASDIIVSKAGGLSSAEITALNKKFIIYHPLPGQERNNAVFLADKKQAMIAESVEEVVALLDDFIKYAIKKEDKINSERVNAAENICRYILNKIK